jgi:hypothetical protein
MSVRKSSGFLDISGIEYFQFEEDFVEENVRCIPMIVRFKMDAAGIKLKLTEWSKFGVQERAALATRPCVTKDEKKSYHDYLAGLVMKYTGAIATPLQADLQPAWADPSIIPQQLEERAEQLNRKISIAEWQGLTYLQRFALLKLCRPGHESKNFIKALNEFKIGKQPTALAVGGTHA